MMAIIEDVKHYSTVAVDKVNDYINDIKHDVTYSALPSGFNRIGNLDKNVSLFHKVIIEVSSPLNGGILWIEATAPQNINFAIQSNWAQKEALGLQDLKNGLNEIRPTKNNNNNKLTKTEIAAKVAGVVGPAILDRATNVGGITHKVLTAQYWQGASPYNVSIPLEFVAQTDPMAEVINPIKELYKLAAPYDIGGVIIPPGPSVAGDYSNLGLITNVYIGSKIEFKNVIVESVSAEIDTRPAKGTGYMLHAKVDFSFSSFYSTTKDDIDKIFISQESRIR